jgi:hypothetical protein
MMFHGKTIDNYQNYKHWLRKQRGCVSLVKKFIATKRRFKGKKTSIINWDGRY